MWGLCELVTDHCISFYFVINRINDGVEAETRKSQASFQII